ncbi:MAG: hypothetical protein K6E84_10235 [Lachnospiraceae bacterium]|nr:hypothetical protein [Lachnospiraceae bacterium]
MKTERLGNLEHFFESGPFKGLFIGMKDLPSKEYLADLLGMIDEKGVLALYWNNPYGVHAICSGEFGFSKEQEKELSRIRMDMQIELLRQSSETFSGIATKWYYPYPTVEFPVAVFSDSHFPDLGECDDNRYNFKDAALELFDEREMTDQLLKTGQFPFFAHAYMLVIAKDAAVIEALPEYTRFSNERQEEMQIRTDLYQDRVVKSAFSHLSIPHINKLKEREAGLAASIAGLSVVGQNLRVNHLTMLDSQAGRAEFEFIEGESLEKRLDQMVERGESEAAAKLMLAFVDKIRNLPQLQPFESGYEFRRWFGDISNAMICRRDAAEEDLPVLSLPVTDIDMIPQNILLTGDEAVLIDYEWCFDFPIPVDYCIFRFLYYFLEGKYRQHYKLEAFEDLYEKAGFTEATRQNFLMMETHFQEYVQQAAAILRNEYDMYGKPLVRRWQLQSVLLNAKGHEITVVYPSQHEEIISSVPLDRGESSGGRQEVYHYKIPITENGEMILILPNVRLLRIGILSVMGGRSKEQEFLSNGDLLAGCVYSFENVQPKLSIDTSVSSASYLMLSLEEIPASADAFGEIKGSIEEYRFLAENRDKQLEALKNSTSWKLTKPLRSLRKDGQS